MPKPFFERIFGSSDSNASQDKAADKTLADSLPADVRKALRYAALFDQMKRGEAMMLLPELEIK